MDLSERNPTFNEDIIQELFNAKFSDLILTETDDQFQRFYEHCTNRNFNGSISFTNMKLSLNFARTFNRIIVQNRHLNVVHVNLERNFLRDIGAIMVV